MLELIISFLLGLAIGIRLMKKFYTRKMKGMIEKEVKNRVSDQMLAFALRQPKPQPKKKKVPVKSFWQ